MSTRILIADKLAPEGAAWLQDQSGVEVTAQTGLEDDALAEALAAHDGVVVRSAVKIREPMFEAVMAKASPRLRGIARAGVGVDNIDLAAATRHGIAVMNSASASTITTAEHAFALMIALARNIGPAHATMATGGWDRNKFVGTQLHGKTLGVVGFGRIGRTMAERALAFNMNVIGYDPFINDDTALEGRVKMVRSFDEMVPLVDIVSFHVPKNDQTLGMLGEAQFASARPNLLVINAARGGIVDEGALIEALDAGRCGGAAIDVYDSEPPAEDHPLRSHPKILCTPHLGASTVEAQEAVAVDACRALLMYLRGEGVQGAVNVGGLNLDLNERQKAFNDLASRMMGLLGAASLPENLQGVRFSMRGETLAGRADTIARFALADLLNRHLDQPINVINAALVAEQRKITTETVIASDSGEDRLAIELIGANTTRRIDGAIFADGLPRVTNLDGYRMNIVPEGDMVILTNDDKPGRIGDVGRVFGEAAINIAEMIIGRKTDDSGDKVAMMILKLDGMPNADVIDRLRSTEGVRSISTLNLPPAPAPLTVN